MSYTPEAEQVEVEVEAFNVASKNLLDKLNNRIFGREWSIEHRQKCREILHDLTDLRIKVEGTFP